jgi:hypothetical protein
MENQSFKVFDHPEFHRRGIIGGVAALVLIIIVLLLQFFQTTFPLPESEGLAVAFGNVEQAGGGDNLNPEPTPEPNKVPITEPNKTDDNATVDDKDADKIKPTDKPTDKPNNNSDNTNNNVNNNALFGGQGNNTGNGKQGDPFGSKTDIGGTGRGDQGNGNGEVGNRKISQKCPSVINRSDWDEEGTAWVYICVSENGEVIESSFVQKTNRNDVSNITKRSQQKIAEDCAKEYKYEAATGQGQACGTIPIRFRKQ